MSSRPRGVSLLHDPQIALFLMQLKEAIARRHYTVIQREKNNDFLARHGMTPKEREEVLLGLQIKDYSSGPGDNGERGVWEFKTKYRGIQIRIKVKLLPFDGVFAKDGCYAKDGYHAKCASFHD
jgi:hypothetical protein